MIPSKVIFSDEFLEKTKHHRPKGLMDRKLKELDDSGVLQRAENRQELGRFLGYTDEEKDKAGRCIYYLIKSGKVTEALSHFDEKKKPHYHYYYNGAKSKKSKKQEIVKPEIKNNVVKITPQKSEISPQLDIKQNGDKIELTITLNINIKRD